MLSFACQTVQMPVKSPVRHLDELFVEGLFVLPGLVAANQQDGFALRVEGESGASHAIIGVKT